MSAVDQVIEIIFQSYQILFYGAPFIFIAWLFLMKILWKKWPVEAVIIEKRGENLIKTNDRAGKYVDPYTGLTGYRLRQAKDNVPIVNYNWVMHNNMIHNSILERLINLLRPTIGTVFFFRYGSKQYKPIKITHGGKHIIQYQEVKDKNGNPVYIKIYHQLDPRDKLGTLNFEVVDWDNMNFMVQEQRASFARRIKKGEFMKQIIIPLGAMVIAALVCVMMIKFSYDWAVGMRGAVGITPPKEAVAPNIPIISDLIPGG